MSYVNAAPEYVAAAATDLANIGSTISSANTAALGPTSGVLAAGADEVSATVAALFDAHAQAYQALSAQAAYFHDQFVQLLNVGATHYALAEAANASPLQTIEQGALSVTDAPSGSQTLTAAQSVIGSGASVGSVASSLPATAAGAAGSSAPAASAGYLAMAGSPTPLLPPALTPLGTPAAAAPAPAGTPVAPMHVVTPDYAPATAGPATPAAASAPFAPVEAATPDVAPATASSAPALAPLGAAPPSAAAPAGAVRPGTPAYSTGTSGQQGYDEESAAIYEGHHRAY
jgi:hypothetical protein